MGIFKKRNALKVNTDRMSDEQLVEQYGNTYDHVLMKFSNKEYVFNHIEEFENDIYVLKQYIEAIKNRI